MSKKAKIFLWILAGLLVVVILYFVFRKPKAPAQANSTITPADPTPKVVQNDNFPLDVGSQGKNVQRLQIALNRIKPTDKLVEDGVFGSKTRVKLLTSLPTTLSMLPMTEKQLNAIIKMGNDA